MGKLKELPADIQETLKVAACIGNQFDIATLTVVTAGDDDDNPRSCPRSGRGGFDLGTR